MKSLSCSETFTLPLRPWSLILPLSLQSLPQTPWLSPVLEPSFLPNHLFVLVLKTFTLPQAPGPVLSQSLLALPLISCPLSWSLSPWDLHSVPETFPLTNINIKNLLPVSPPGRTIRWLWSRWAQWRRPSSPWSSSTIMTWERTTTCGSPFPSPPSEPGTQPSGSWSLLWEQTRRCPLHSDHSNTRLQKPPWTLVWCC